MAAIKPWQACNQNWTWNRTLDVGLCCGRRLLSAFESCKNVFIQARGGVYTFRTTIYLSGKKWALRALSWRPLECWAEGEFCETSYSQVKSLQTSGIYGINHLSVLIQFIMLSYRYRDYFGPKSTIYVPPEQCLLMQTALPNVMWLLAWARDEGSHCLFPSLLSEEFLTTLETDCAWVLLLLCSRMLTREKAVPP